MDSALDFQSLIARAGDFFSNYGLKLLLAAVIFIVGRWVSMAVVAFMSRAMRRAGSAEVVVRFVANIGYTLLLIMVILAALGQLGVQTTSFIAVIGAAGLAVGLALKDSLSNFAAGVMVILFRPFRVGDFIQAGGVEGVVEEVQLFSTIMRTADNRRVILPNNSIMADSITNFSANETRRIDLVIGAGYGDDIDTVKDLLLEIVRAHPKVLDEPGPFIAVGELADSSVQYLVRPWVATADFWTTRCDLLETIKKRFDAAGISIPFPQREIHVLSGGERANPG